jgi:hypothetical protein
VVVDVSCGWEHSLALAQDGSLFSWGKNDHFECGHKIPGVKKKLKEDIKPPLVSTPAPVDFSFLDSIVWMAAGMEESLLITKNGNLYTWGANHNLGQGVGDFLAVTRPRLVRGVKFKLPPTFVEKIWTNPFCWISLGRSDPGSEFSRFPVEILFHFVTVLLA